ncbi:MAG: hypothetical protein U0324_42345 [Polyangiales bacterium]
MTPREASRDVRAWSAAVAALALAAYHNAPACGFVFDDHAAVLRNEVVTGPLSLARIAASDFWGRTTASRFVETWRPLTSLTLALDWHLAGGRPWLFHLTNVLLHAAAAVVVLRAGWNRLPSNAGAVAAAAVFAVHTLHTDAVTAVVGRADVLAFLAMAAAWRLHGRPWSALALLAGMLAKESAALAVPLLAARDLRDGVPWRAGPGRFGPHLAALAVALAARVAVLGGLRGNRPPSALRNPLVGADLATRAVTSVRTFGHAVRLTLAPLDLLPDYGPAAVAPSAALDDVVVLGAAAIALLAGLVAWAWRRRHPLGDAALWTLVVGLAAVNVPVLLPRPFAERWWYPASAGACLLFGAALARVRLRLGLAPMALVTAVVVVALGGLTVRHNRVWRTDADLFRDAASVEPRLAVAQVGIAEIDMRFGAAREAYARCAIAARVAPWSAEPWGCLAGAAERLGRRAELPGLYARMLAAEPVPFDRRVQHVMWLARADRAAARRALDALARERAWSRHAQARLADLRRSLDAR